MLIVLLFISKSVPSLFGYVFLLLFGVLYSLLIIASRYHYSVDVIIAWFITISVYLLYHGGLYRIINKAL